MKMIKGDVSFWPTYHKAKKNHHCDGCGDEWLIYPGDMYQRSRAICNGRFHTMKLCARCCIALQSKLVHRKGEAVLVERGGLKWARLSNAFKKAWTRFAKSIKDKTCDYQAAQDTLYRELHVSGLGRERDMDKQELSALQKARRDNRAIRRELKAAREELAALRAQTVKAALGCKLAWLKGEGYEDAHKALVDALGGDRHDD